MKIRILFNSVNCPMRIYHREIANTEYSNFWNAWRIILKRQWQNFFLDTSQLSLTTSFQCTYHLIRLYHHTFIIVLTITNVNKPYYIINELFLYVHLPNISNTFEMRNFWLKGWGIFVWSLWRHKLYKLFEISNIEYLHCNIYVQLSAGPNICNLE